MSSRTPTPIKLTERQHEAALADLRATVSEWALLTVAEYGKESLTGYGLILYQGILQIPYKQSARFGTQIQAINVLRDWLCLGPERTPRKAIEKALIHNHYLTTKTSKEIDIWAAYATLWIYFSAGQGWLRPWGIREIEAS